jgi:hypothetical protein
MSDFNPAQNVGSAVSNLGCQDFVPCRPPTTNAVEVVLHDGRRLTLPVTDPRSLEFTVVRWGWFDYAVEARWAYTGYALSRHWFRWTAGRYCAWLQGFRRWLFEDGPMGPRANVR